MQELAIYLLKINVAIALFYFGYFFLLKRLTFYTLNRFYLVFAIICSAVFPFLSLPVFFKKAEVIVYAFSNTETIPFLLPEVEQQPLFIWTILLYLYWLVVAVGGIKLIIRLLSLYRVRLQSSPQIWHGYSFRNLKAESTPFSFLGTIYLNKELHDDEELQTILKHEKVHTQGLHSLDVLLAEVWILFSWFNPLSYFVKKAIQVNIEFIADHEVVTQGTSHQQYQSNLLRSATQSTHIPLVNQFSFLSLKSRIIMMNKKQSSKNQLGKYVFLIPVIIVSLFVFGVSKAYDESSVIELIATNEPDIEESQISSVLQDSLKSKTSTKDSVIELKVGDQKGLVVRGIVDPAKNPIIFIDGVEQKDDANTTIKSMNPNDIESIEVLKDDSAVAIYGEKGKNGVILITTKSAPNKTQVDKADKGKASSSMSSTFTVSKDGNGDPVNVVQVEGEKTDEEEVTFKQKLDDAVIVRHSTMHILPSKAEVQRNKKSTEVDTGTIGEKAKASKITLVGDSTNVKEKLSGKNNPLYIVDGEEIDGSAISKLSPDKIKSIKVYKDAESIKLYGEKGKLGVIVFETKK